MPHERREMMEQVIMSEMWCSKTVILTDEHVDNSRACVEVWIQDLEGAKILVAYTHGEAIELAQALLSAAGVQFVIRTRGITSADFEAASEPMDIDTREPRNMRGLIDGLHNDNGYDPETAGIE